MSSKHGTPIGIEAKIEDNLALDAIGRSYESWRRTTLNWLQENYTEAEVEKRLQKEFGLQWAWADSIATEAKQVYDQLTTAKQNQIDDLTRRIKAKISKTKTVIKTLEKKIKKPPKSKQEYLNITQELLGLKSKIRKINRLQKQLKTLKSTKRLHICFGSQKLFNAQHHLVENNYKQHSEWLEDWRKKRSGRFFCIGKSTLGGGTMMKVKPLDDNGNYQLTLTVPLPLQPIHGKTLKINFHLNERETRRRSEDLNYALSNLKPITVQVLRREHKKDQWYIHLTTYVQEIPTIHRNYWVETPSKER